MSEENVERYRRNIAALNRRDVEAVLAEVHPEIEWDMPLQRLIGGEAAIYHGHEGVREYFRDMDEAFAEIQVDYPDIRDLGDRVLAIGRFGARGRQSGVPIESPLGAVVEMRDGKATRVRTFLDPTEALEAAGLEEEAMSEENVERIRRAFDAFNRRDLDAFLALIDPEVEFTTRFKEMEGGPYYRGHDGVREWCRDLLAIFPDFSMEVLEVRDLGDSGIVALRVRGQGLDSGVPFEETMWAAGEWRDGKMTRWRNFGSEAEALEAFELRG